MEDGQQSDDEGRARLAGWQVTQRSSQPPEIDPQAALLVCRH